MSWLLLIGQVVWAGQLEANPVVAVAGPDTLRRRDLQLQLALEDNSDVNPENIRPILDNWVNGMLLYREASRAGFSSDETTQALAAESERQYLIGLMTRQLTDTVKVTDNEVFDYYQRRKLDFATRLRFAYLVLPDEQSARATLKDLKAGRNFTLLANERSLDRGNNPRAETVLAGLADTLLGLDRLLQDSIYALSRSLPEGGISAPIKVGSVWWLVKPLVRQPMGEVPDLVRVRGDIAQALKIRKKREVLERTIAQLRKRAKVTDKPRGDTTGLLAAVNSARLTRRYLDLQLEGKAELREKDLPRLVEVWVKSELLFQEAQRLGLGRDETTLVLLRERHREYVTDRMADWMLRRLSVPLPEVFDYFQQHKTEYLHAVRIRHILVGAESVARGLLEELKAGRDFEVLARERSYDRAIAQGMESRPLDRLDPGLNLDVRLEEVVFQLKPGAVSPILHTNQGYWLIKVTDRRQVRTDIAFEQVQNRITAFLTQLKFRDEAEKLLARLRQEQSVQLMPEAYWH